MEYIVIALVAFGTAMLTFFSGFGLGTILMPVFALFFPVHVSIAITAIVHLANNIFKMGLIWKKLDIRTTLLFAVPAAIAAILGALLLSYLSTDSTLFTYTIGGKQMEITTIKLVISSLLIVFALVEISKKLGNLSIKPNYLPLGGAISGFFGGLSGHQGALRSLFLLRVGLSKEGFIATGIAVAIVIDISRLTVYGSSFLGDYFSTIGSNSSMAMVIIACAAAFVGSFVGRKILRKVTMRSIQLTVGVMILILALLLAIGVI